MLFSQIKRTVEIPVEIKKDLNKCYSSWQFPSFSNFFQKWYNERNLNPYFIEGDFNGDGKRDICLQVIFKDKKENYIKRIIIVYLGEDSSFDKHILETMPFSPSLDVNLDVIKRGTKEQDVYGKIIRYKYDSIHIGYDEKGSSSYVYKAGKFAPFKTGD
jgi:hypothetical protein